MNPFKGLLEKFALYNIKKVVSPLSIQDRIKYIAKLLGNYYQFDDILSDEFYRFILFRISKNDVKFLNKENIFQVIDEYKELNAYIDDLDWFITPKQYLNTSIRHINKIKELLSDKMHVCPTNFLNQVYADEVIYKLSRQPYFLDRDCVILAYKLYLSIGFNQSIALLQNKYGEVSFATLYFFFYPIDVKKIDILNEDLMLFLFGGEKRDSAMTFILKGASKNMFLNFSYFYENFLYYYEILKGNLSKKRVEELLEDRFLNANPIYPNIRRDIVSDMLSSFSNRYNYSYSPKEIESINYHFYEENMSKLITASIPQVHLKYKHLRADVLSKNDPKILVMGYRANNCFRINGDASILFSKAVISKDFRVVSVSSDKDNDIAMMLITRNGNVLISQGIEISRSYQDKESRKEIYVICSLLLKRLKQEMNCNGDEILACIMGCSNSNVTDFNSNVLPFRVSPVFDGNPFQNFYNGFQFPQCLIDLKENASLNDIKLFLPTQKYFDEREKVLHLTAHDYSYVRNIVNQRLMAISYYADTQKHRIMMQTHHETKEIYCNNDWYLIVFEDGEIDGVCLDNDVRAKEEYEFYLSRVKSNLYNRK